MAGGGDGGAEGLRQRLEKECDEAALPGVPSADALRTELGAGVGCLTLAEALQDSLRRRADASTADGAAMVEQGDLLRAAGRAGDKVGLARRAHLPGGDRGAARMQAALLLMGNMKDRLPNPPETVETFVALPLVPGEGGGELSGALRALAAKLPGDGDVTAVGHVSNGPHHGIARKVAAPTEGGTWALAGIGHAVRVLPLGDPLRAGAPVHAAVDAVAVRPLRALIVDAAVRELLVLGGGHGTAYVTVGRGGGAGCSTAAALLAAVEARVGREEVDAARIGSIEPPAALRGRELDDALHGVGGRQGAGAGGLAPGGGAPPLMQPPPGGGLPPQGGGYPPQGAGYPPQGWGYPPQGWGYPPPPPPPAGGGWGWPAGGRGQPGPQAGGAGGGLEDLLRRNELSRQRREAAERQNWASSDDERERTLGPERARTDPKRRANADCGSPGAPQWCAARVNALVRDPQGFLSFVPSLLREWAELSRDGQVDEVRRELEGKSQDEVCQHLPQRFARRAAHGVVRRLRDLARLGEALQGLPPERAERWARIAVQEGLLESTDAFYRYGYSPAVGASYQRRWDSFLRDVADSRLRAASRSRSRSPRRQHPNPRQRRRAAEQQQQQQWAPIPPPQGGGGGSGGAGGG
eukprot:gene3970-6257_t